MTDLISKPADCTCGYPDIMNRNMTGHDFDCPAHKRIISKWNLAEKKQEVPEGAHVYQIDPNGKYVIQVEVQLTSDELNRLKEKWEEFINNPDRHAIVFLPGIKLLRVEVPETKQAK